MLAEAQQRNLDQLVQESSTAELLWMSGYLAGLASGQNRMPAKAVAAEKQSQKQTITLLYGTETGNAKQVATQLATGGKQKGFMVKLCALEQYKLSDLKQEKNLFIIISTHGDGEPPAAAKRFYDYLFETSEQLTGLPFSVLALGSHAYPLFCQAGMDVDAQLEKMGATRFAPLVTCDENYEEAARHWMEGIWRQLEHGAAPAEVPHPPKKAKKAYFEALISGNINLNDRGSRNTTHHIELSLSEAADYAPGDALAIVPENRTGEVEKILGLTGIPFDHPVAINQETLPAGEWLQKRLNILYLNASVIKKYAALVQLEIPETRMDFYDLLRIYPVKNTAGFEAALALLTPNTPRLYTIASSPMAHPGEIHLTVLKNNFQKNGHPAHGLCSSYLTDLPLQGRLRFFIHKNKRFRLPAADADLIMIGPGTGIAPFRSFLAERDVTGATGRNWLFFGAQHFTTDFLYQTEIQAWKDTGLLTKISLAFSRDQKEKTYVQDCLLREAEAVWEWINNGAGIYVCGDKDPMGTLVENALLQIIASQLDNTPPEAKAFLEKLAQSGRYVKDLY